MAMVVMATTCGALLLAFVGHVGVKVIDFRTGLIRELTSLAEVIGASSAAPLTFDDARAAEEALSSLRGQPNVVAARLYTASGEPFASYLRRGSMSQSLPPAPGPEGYRFVGGSLHLVRRISLRGETVGTIAIQAGLSALVANEVRSAAAVFFIMAGVGIVALLAARRLQGLVVAPIQELADAARQVTESKDFSVRVRSRARDEIGTLATAFNGMLAEIESRDALLSYMALHDPLTGLPNRALFTDRLTLAMAGARRHHSSLAIMFLDLDRFKIVNDSLGHAAGDELLKLAAERLRRGLRNEDTVARNGGDEFVLLLPGLGEPGAAALVANRILASLREPFDVGGQSIFISCTIGISLYPADGDDAGGLVRQADIAMYRAKDNGRDGYQLYTAALQERAVARMDMERSMREALLRQEFLLHYQPVVDLRSGSILGAEALLRWPVPGRGFVPPSEFIPVAEDCGLIVALGEWVLRAACRQAQAWRSHGSPAFRISVNLSTRQFRNSNLAPEIEAILTETGLPAGNLELEITESLVMDSSTQSQATLNRLRSAGVRFALDDFGTGYSSLAYLRRFALNVVKIDRSFVQDIATDVKAAAVARAIIALAHGLGLEVVAEGVETEEQRDALVLDGCDSMQGFLVSRPLPPDQFVRLVRAADRADDGSERLPV
jgi:diguanylate cyclase (GGDEF)-like protein